MFDDIYHGDEGRDIAVPEPAVVPSQKRRRYPVTLIGRQRELGRIQGHLSDWSSDHAPVLVVNGFRGTGRTRILATATQMAEALGYQVMKARATGDEYDQKLGVVRQLFESHAFEATCDLECKAGQCGDAGIQSVFHELYLRVVNMAREAPVVVVVDDIHSADRESLRWLTYLSRRSYATRVRIVAGTRAGDRSHDPDLLHELLAAADQITLAPFTREECRQLMDRWAPRSSDYVDRCFAYTAGNPLLLANLLEPPAASGAADPLEKLFAHATGGALMRTVQLDISRLNDAERRLLKAIAVLRVASIEIGVATAGLDLLAGLDATAALASRGLLSDRGNLSVEPPLFRDATIHAMSAQENHEFRVAAAHALLAACAPISTVVEQLLSTKAAVGEAWVTKILIEEARQASLSGQHEYALRVLRRALAEPADAETCMTLLREFCSIALTADEPGAAVSETSDLMRRFGSDADIAEATGLLIGICLDRPGLLAEARLRTTASTEKLALPWNLCVAVDWVLTASPAPHAGQSVVGLDSADLPPSLRPVADGFTAFCASLQRGSAEDVTVPAIAALEAAVADLDLDGGRVVACVALGGLALINVGEYELVEIYCGKAIADRDATDPRFAAWVYTVQALARLRSGRTQEAAESACLALEVFQLSGGTIPTAGHMIAAAVLCESQTDSGNLLEAKAALVPLRAFRSVGSGWGYWYLRCARGKMLVAAREYGEALHDLQDCARGLAEWAGANPAALPWRASAIMAAAASGDRDRALELVESEVNAARAWSNRRNLVVALVMRGAIAGAKTGMEDLAEACRVLDDPSSHLHTSSSGRRRKRTVKSEFPRRLEHALDLLRRRALAGDAQRLAELMKVHAWQGIPASARFGVESLTPHERRLIARALEGRTNQAIAEELHVSRRAVEFHFTRIYQKLGVARRVQLHAVMGQSL